jgi:hypothetical protein
VEAIKKAASNEKQEGEKQREDERRGDQKEDALSAFRSCIFLLLLNIQPPYSIGLEPGGHTAASNLKAQMRSRRERSRERMSGTEIRRRMRFLLFGLASSSSTPSLCIRLASSLLEARRPANISLLRLSRS